MDFELPEELRLLKDNLRKFVDKELIPLEREVVNDIKLQKELAQAAAAEGRRARVCGTTTCRRNSAGSGLGMMAKVIIWSESLPHDRAALALRSASSAFRLARSSTRSKAARAKNI